MTNLLEIRDLTVELMTARGIVYAISGVDMDIRPGEIHGVVGESGCGKSMTAKSILRLHHPKRSRVGGSITFEGEDLLSLPMRRMKDIRGGEISMIFQDPMMSLNPVLSIGKQIAEMYRFHSGASRGEAYARSCELLEKLGLEPSEKRYKQYPFELSGGMQQRVMIAMAIACSPKLLIADEPTTALDVTIQAQILELISALAADIGMSVLLITHNFGVVAETCQRVSVMYAGKVVEVGDTRTLLRDARHPYSRALIGTIPSMESRGTRLLTIPGAPPALFAKPSTCPFAPRCRYVIERCRQAAPALTDCGNGQRAACFRAGERGLFDA